MIVDSSAILAVYSNEAECAAFTKLLAAAASPRVSAATYVECSIVIDRRHTDVSHNRLDDLVASFGIEVVAFTPEHARAAGRAHQRFGRGSGHPAGLNLGDCFSYALAISEDEPMLFKGDDFTHTDVRVAAKS